MKKFTSILLVAVMLNLSLATAEVTVPQKSCFDSNVAGSEFAEKRHSNTGWWVAGASSGFLLGLIGTGVVWTASLFTNPKPSAMPEDTEARCFQEGYTKTAKGKNKFAAGIGGLAGTAVAVATILIIRSNTD